MNKTKIRSGRAGENSVTYFLEGSVVGYRAIRDKDGTIRVIEIIPYDSISADLSLLRFYGMILLLYLIRKSVLTFNLPTWLYHIPTIYWIGYLIKSVIEIWKKPETLKYHGAEHKIANWFNKNAQDDEIKEIQKYSRIHLRCGTNLYGTIILFQIIASISFAFFNYHITEFVTSILPLFLYTSFPFNILGLLIQFITTSEPLDEHVEVAYAAISEALKHPNQMVSYTSAE